MTTSGSYDFSVTAQDIIRDAFEIIGRVVEEEPLTAGDLTTGKMSLNMLAKQLMAEAGMRLWKTQDAIVFFDTTKVQYNLSLTGDHASLENIKTEVATAALSGATTISVDSASGMAISDNIGVELDNGALQWTTISNISGTTITLAAALTNSVAINNNVYAYTTKLVRPLRVVAARYISDSGDETPVSVISNEEYFALSNKTDAGRVNLVYYQPQLTHGVLYMWNKPNTVADRLGITCYLPIQDFDTNSNTPDFPIEWSQALVFGLAHKLCFKYGIATDKREAIRIEYLTNLEAVKGFDKEITSIFFNPYGSFGYEV